MPSTMPTPGDTSWFVHDRFGLFIHWGLYAMTARCAWIKQQAQISEAQYDLYFKHFDPDLYDPAHWANVARDAGMKYMVVTTKHHDGFCLWDSKLTDYKATNTPARRDLIRPMHAAFREAGLRVGFYHSLIDWHHPQFAIDDVHVLWNHPERAKLNEQRDQRKYIAYLHGQVRELLTDYRDIDIMWLDYSYKGGRRGLPATLIGKGREDWDSENLLKLVRELRPGIILNDRLDLEHGWDITTPEQHLPRQWPTLNGQHVVWETCQTFHHWWGYHRDQNNWKSVKQIITLLVDTVSKGGNLLLNVGPTARGEWDERVTSRLSGVGKWMRWHSRSIYGCTQAPEGFVTPQDCRLTYNPTTNRLYVHVLAWPCKHLHLDHLSDRLEYAQLMHDGAEVAMRRYEGGETTHSNSRFSLPSHVVTLELPVEHPPTEVPVIECFLK